MEANNMTIVTPPTESMEKQGGELMRRAQALEIVDTASYEAGAAFVADIKMIFNRIELEFDGTAAEPGPVKKANAAWKSLVALRDKMLKPFADAETLVKGRMGQYQWEQNEKRRKEAEQAEAAARKLAEDERLNQAEAAERSGDKAAAEALLDAPIVPVAAAPVTTPEAPKVKGTSYREDWDFQITNPNILPRQYLKPDLEAIRKVVKALGRNANIAGVMPIPKPVISSRGGANLR